MIHHNLLVISGVHSSVYIPVLQYFFSSYFYRVSGASLLEGMDDIVICRRRSR